MGRTEMKMGNRPGASRPHEVHVVAESSKTNSLGRALSMALVAAIDFPVVVWVVDDGELWTPAAQFWPTERLRLFKARHWRAAADEIGAASARGTVVAWFSKGTWPLDRMAAHLQSLGGVAVIADFDDDDVAIMRRFRRSSRLNALKMPPFRRKSPSRLLHAQHRIWANADALTFSSAYLRSTYSERYEIPQVPTAVIPHARPDIPGAEQADSGRLLRLGFLGTMRPHKGASALLALSRADDQIRIVTFEQRWQIPEDVSDRWVHFPPTASLPEIYASVDFLLLPMDPDDDGARGQLPAKLVDAARSGVAIAATRTPVIDEYLGENYVRVASWDDPSDVISLLRRADSGRLGDAARHVFDQRFETRAVAASFGAVLQEALEPSR